MAHVTCKCLISKNSEKIPNLPEVLECLAEELTGVDFPVQDGVGIIAAGDCLGYIDKAEYRGGTLHARLKASGALVPRLREVAMMVVLGVQEEPELKVEVVKCQIIRNHTEKQVCYLEGGDGRPTASSVLFNE